MVNFRRPLTTAALLLISVLVLSGCASRSLFTESMETAIPNALVESELGIVSAEAGLSQSGFAQTISVGAVFEDDSFSADEMNTLLQIVVLNTNMTGAETLSISGAVGEYPNDDPLDLGGYGAELGFPRKDSGYASTTTFSAPWGDVLDYLNEKLSAE